MPSDKATPSLICKSGQDAWKLRKQRGLSQQIFWSKIGVTQSGGSRYESGRTMPLQVAYLIHLTYGSEKQSQALLEWLRRDQ